MNLSPILKLALVLGGSFYVYKNVKNEWAQGVAMATIGFVVANNLPIVQDALMTRVIAPGA